MFLPLGVLPDDPAAGAESDEPRRELALPLLQLNLAGAELQVGRGERGDRALLIGPVMLQVLVPLESEAARAIARELTGGIEIAGAIDLTPPPSRR